MDTKIARAPGCRRVIDLGIICKQHRENTGRSVQLNCCMAFKNFNFIIPPRSLHHPTLGVGTLLVLYTLASIEPTATYGQHLNISHFIIPPRWSRPRYCTTLISDPRQPCHRLPRWRYTQYSMVLELHENIVVLVGAPLYAYHMESFDQFPLSILHAFTTVAIADVAITAVGRVRPPHGCTSH